MGAANEIKIVFPQELLDLVSSEGVGNASIILTPSLSLSIRVRPQEITHQPLIRHVHRPFNRPYLVQALHLRRQAAVHADDLVVDDGGDGETVEALGEGLPEADAVAAFALVVEAVDSVNGGALVVSSEEEEVVGKLDFVAEEKADCLHALLPSVNVVAEE